MRSTSALCSLRNSSIVTRLPSDFDIFSPPKLQHAVVHPVAGKWLAGEAFGLGDFVFVVREDQVIAAAVDIDLLTQVAQVHRRAFNMPAGAALTPRAVPGGFAGFGRFPQGKIHRVLFPFVDLDARAGLHIFQLAPGELAVIFIPLHAEINIPVRPVGIALSISPWIMAMIWIHLLGGARVDRGGQYVQVAQGCGGIHRYSLRPGQRDPSPSGWRG